MKPPILASGTRGSVIPIVVSAREGYRLWSETYDSDPNPLLALEFRTLARKMMSLEGKVFLDVGCGTGRWTEHAAAEGARCIGIDLSREMLAVAQSKVGLAGRLSQADGCSLPLPDRCADLVLSSFSLGYAGRLELSVRELSRVAKRGARVLVSDMHPLARHTGWQRSFRHGSEVYEIENGSYTVEQLIEAGRTVDLVLRELQAPHIGEPERRIMRRAGKAAAIDKVSAVPAVLVVEWERR